VWSVGPRYSAADKQEDTGPSSRLGLIAAGYIGLRLIPALPSLCPNQTARTEMAAGSDRQVKWKEEEQQTLHDASIGHNLGARGGGGEMWSGQSVSNKTELPTNLVSRSLVIAWECKINERLDRNVGQCT
jgi:hypothetical protein